MSIQIVKVVDCLDRPYPWAIVYTPEWIEAFDYSDDELELIPIVQKIRLKGYTLDRSGSYSSFCVYLLRLAGNVFGDLTFADPKIIPEEDKSS